MAKRFIAWNGPEPTTSARVKATTGTSLLTTLQVATPSTTGITVIQWGISFDGTAANTPIECELIQTDVAATVTSLTPTKWGNPNDEISLCAGGSALTGYTSTSEGSITTVRTLDAQSVAPTSQYVMQFPLGREPVIPVSKFLRIRILAGTAVNCLAFICWEE